MDTEQPAAKSPEDKESYEEKGTKKQKRRREKWYLTSIKGGKESRGHRGEKSAKPGIGFNRIFEQQK